ncbi:MAG TPA: FAD-linked oxidase C-terminal domain-containing protein, partial [bacterium]|nr:FAD-linked oxidase C-terminal domain-containing protein [bacterium]
EAAEAQFIIELDGNDPEALELQAEKLAAFLVERGAIDVFVAAERAEKDRLWELRRNLTDAIKQVGVQAFSEDVVVPRANIPELLLRVNALKSEFPVDIAAFGHIGDGNVHVYCVRNDLPEERWQALKPAYIDRLFSITRALDGTISGEHGIGLTKRPYLRHALGATEIALMRALKASFDPHGILNPGKILPDA